MAKIDHTKLTLGADLDAYLAAVVLDGARLPNGQVVSSVSQSFNQNGVLVQTFNTIKAAGWSPSDKDTDLADLQGLLTARGVVTPANGSKLSKLRSIIDQLNVTAEA